MKKSKTIYIRIDIDKYNRLEKIRGKEFWKDAVLKWALYYEEKNRLKKLKV